ncbi:MAG: hypothetical protein JWO45_805, partial [Spartobacteria bacterium]|nr:hypothetical protein [Spartobacteria bacterium]
GTRGLRNENVGYQAPDFSMPDASRIKVEKGNVFRAEPDQNKDERIKTNEDANQSRDAEKTESALQLVEPAHAGESSASFSLAKLSDHEPEACATLA